jgi:adenylate cyclase
MLRPKLKRDIYRIIPFGLIWLVSSIVYTLLEKGLLSNLKNYPATGNPYHFSRNLFITPILSLVAGLFMGALEVRYFNRFFIRRSFTKKIIYKTIISLGTITFFLIVLTVVTNAFELRSNIFDHDVWHNTWAFFFDYAFFNVSVYMAATILISQLYTEVSENMGQTILLNFFTGKYHRPTEEERIFMFLDMKSSTTIAESLGHLRYFDMLKEYYSDLSDPVINYSGEIYQYVGDEIVVSWKLKNGLLNNNCIQCFFEMKAAITMQSEKYIAQFGLVPQFKAGLHLGKVTTGEIGVLKKEIIFTGDVLNTTARIQSLCNAYKVDLLISSDLIEQLELNPQFQIQSLGENKLRGRGEMIELFTLGYVK